MAKDSLTEQLGSGVAADSLFTHNYSECFVIVKEYNMQLPLKACCRHPLQHKPQSWRCVRSECTLMVYKLWPVMWASCIFHAFRETSTQPDTICLTVTAETINGWKLCIHMGFKASCETQHHEHVVRVFVVLMMTEHAWNIESCCEAICLLRVLFDNLSSVSALFFCSSLFSLAQQTNLSKLHMVGTI